MHFLKSKQFGILWVLLSLAYVGFGFFLPPERTIPTLVELEPAQQPSAFPFTGQGFAEGSVYPSTTSIVSLTNLKVVGSWLGSDASMGTTTSLWYHTHTSFSLMIAGYPGNEGNYLKLEIENQAGEITSIYLDDSNPGEAWVMKTIKLPKSLLPSKIRIVATDGSKSHGGWLGVSQPFVLKYDTSWLTLSLMALIRIVLTVITSILLVLSPGLMLRHYLKQKQTIWKSFALLPLPGIIWLVFGGLLTWVLATVIDSHLIAILIAVPVMLACLWLALRIPVADLVSPVEKKTLIFFLVIITIAVAKASYSQGPVGELYAGTISRTLEVGDRSDSRISFHVVQLVAHGTHPYSALGTSYFAPWSFSHRGPLAGFATSQIVLLSGAKVPTNMPNQAWSPFDPEGFAAYRIGMIVINATCLIVLFGLAQFFLNSRAALFTVALASLSPFIIHEMYFTWPKLQAATLVLMAFYLLANGRAGWAGFIAGVGYLFHPSALLSLPILLLGWLILQANKSFSVKFSWTSHQFSLEANVQRQLLSGFIWMILSISFIILFWRMVNGSHFQQSGFLNYFIQVDGRPAADVWAWLQGRTTSLLNTLVPFYLYFFHADHSAVNVVGGRSPDIVVFFFQYWNTIPFGFGIIGFGLLLIQSYRGAQYFSTLFILLIALPFLLFFIYWGAATTGMMREGLQVWVLCTLLFLVWSWASKTQTVQLSHWLSLLLASRGFEVLLMLLLPTLLTTPTYLSQINSLIDLIALTMMVLGVSWLSWQAYLIGRSSIFIKG